MKTLIGLAGLALAISGCGLLPRDVQYILGAEKVELVSSVKADAPLTVRVTYTIGGCERFKQFGTERTINALKLSVIGSRREGNGVTCATGFATFSETYTDPGSPTRTNPFEVVVNGKSYGKISVE
jgi:hypothetical protein